MYGFTAPKKNIIKKNVIIVKLYYLYIVKIRKQIRKLIRTLIRNSLMGKLSLILQRNMMGVVAYKIKILLGFLVGTLKEGNIALVAFF